MTGDALWLLGALFLAHYLGDFTPLLTARMLEAKAQGSPLKPIAGHAAVHSVLVGVAVAVLAAPAWSLLLAVCGIEFGTHFVIDATRGRLARVFPVLRDPERGVYWHVFGLDQLAHMLVLLGLATLVL